MSKSREQINQFLSEINLDGKTVLDVGVQDNPAAKYCNGSARKYLTMDVDREWRPNFLYDLNDDKIDIGYLGNLVNQQHFKNRFDVVFCLEVLEHCWSPVQALENLFDFTKEGGTCYISTPFINPLHDKWDYLRYTPEWFEKVLPMVGFKEFTIKKRYATLGVLDLIKFYQAEGLRMSKIRLNKGQHKDQALIGLFIEAKK